MRGRACVLCRRRLWSRCACLLLAPGKTRNCHQEQKHYPLLQHIFTLQNPIHYRLLTTRTFSRSLHFPKHRPSSEVARSLRSLHHGRHSPISRTWLISSKNGGMACTMARPDCRQGATGRPYLGAKKRYQKSVACAIISASGRRSNSIVILSEALFASRRIRASRATPRSLP